MNKEEEVIYGYEIEMKKEEHNIKSSNLDYNLSSNLSSVPKMTVL